MSIFWEQILTQETYALYGARFYTNTYGRWDEFFSDIKTFSRVSKLLVSRKNAKTKVSLKNIVNNYICLGNVFTGDSLARLAFFLGNPICYPEIKTILYFIHRLPPSVPEFDLSAIPYDSSLAHEIQNM